MQKPSFSSIAKISASALVCALLLSACGGSSGGSSSASGTTTGVVTPSKVSVANTK